MAESRSNSESKGAAPLKVVPASEQVSARFGAAAVNAAQPPEILHEFLDKLAPRLRFGEVSQAILQAFANIDVTSEKVAAYLRGNPYLEASFVRVVQTLSKREEIPSLESAVVLLGMQNSRNTILALQLHRMVTGKFAEWDEKDGKLKLVPKDVLRFALKVEEALGGTKANYADLAFAAGAVFDALALAAQELAINDPKKVLSYLEVLFAHGLKTATIAVELSKTIPELSASKHVFAGGLLHDLGKGVMVALSADYLRFVEELGKKDLPRGVRYYVERERFGITHAAVGALALKGFGLFEWLERPIAFHHEPDLLKSAASATASKKLDYLAACLLMLATNVASSFKKLDNPDDPQVKVWRGEELKDFKLDGRALQQALGRVSF